MFIGDTIIAFSDSSPNHHFVAITQEGPSPLSPSWDALSFFSDDQLLSCITPAAALGLLAGDGDGAESSPEQALSIVKADNNTAVKYWPLTSGLNR
ncbi:hypothetical protein [Pseudomonas akapageensis]|uniref:hypothetical protein n=1 Tax=Pseudomonas akapageensis TaxID=2609961 RepID=UPI00140B5BE3|nr:hypothetical protein [Pseudomonas akapageensis]